VFTILTLWAGLLVLEMSPFPESSKFLTPKLSDLTHYQLVVTSVSLKLIKFSPRKKSTSLKRSSTSMSMEMMSQRLPTT
jgi:hypothetical protein